MNRIISIGAFLILSALAFSETIDKETREKIYKIGLKNGVPVSITRQLMWEESRGNPKAVSRVTSEGYVSKGLFQLYAKPEYIDWFLDMFWNGDKEDFDIFNPIHNATVALAYLSWLHGRYDDWFLSLVYYNHGDIKGYSKETRAYALRIVNAK